MPLTLETRPQQAPIPRAGPFMLPPRSGEDAWIFRVKLTETQAIVGFPKFHTIGIGFAREQDWNTNLPYKTEAEQILDHIWHNAGDESITRADALAAIVMVQEAARRLRSGFGFTEGHAATTADPTAYAAGNASPAGV